MNIIKILETVSMVAALLYVIDLADDEFDLPVLAYYEVNWSKAYRKVRKALSLIWRWFND